MKSLDDMIADQKKKGGHKKHFLKKGISKSKSYLHREDQQMDDDNGYHGRNHRGNGRGGYRGGNSNNDFRGGRFERKPFVKPH